MGQGLVFEGSLVLLVPDCCSLVENLAFQSVWDFCFAKKNLQALGRKDLCLSTVSKESL